MLDNTTTEVVEADAGEKSKLARRTGDLEFAAEAARAGDVLGETKWGGAMLEADLAAGVRALRGGRRRVGELLIASPGYGFGAPYVCGSQSFERANIKV